MSASPNGWANKFAYGYANFVVKHATAVLMSVLAVFAVSLWLTSKLTINSNQLELISQELPEVKEVKRVIDMVGGAGHLILGVRNDDEKQLKAVADDIAEMLKADKENVRTVSYRLPVEFAQQKMPLFIRTEDLIEGKNRINAYLKDQKKRSNPFFIEIKKTEPVKLDLSDLIAKYGSIGKRSILDEYNLSQDKKMILILIKPMWDGTQIDKTQAFLEKLNAQFAEYSKNNKHGVTLHEPDVRKGEKYDSVGEGKTVTYGFTGTYKTSVDDSYAIKRSLPTVTTIAFLSVLVIIIVFFRKIAPALMVKLGIVFGTVIMYAFAYLTLKEVNMITSMMGAIMLGLGIDFGIHFIFRTRLELGQGKPYDEAIRDALVNAGRPAFVSAIVVGGSFFVLMVSDFRGFSQFGWLAGWGTIITGFIAFLWTPALLVLLGRKNAAWPEKLIGRMDLKTVTSSGAEPRIPNPKVTLTICLAVVAVLCAFIVPWTDMERPKNPTLIERLKTGMSFNYNTRALMPEDHTSIIMQDEIGRRFQISADPIAVYTKDLAETKEVYDELTNPANAKKYDRIDQVVSIYTFVPPPDRAAANAKVLEEWKAELTEIFGGELSASSMPPALQDKFDIAMKMLEAKPYGIEGVPEQYRSSFRELATTPELTKDGLPAHGYLTFIYPGIDLWDGKEMLKFADQTSVITVPSGKQYRSAGLPILYAVLARIVLNDAFWMVVLTGVWILGMHWLDFRKPALALASVIPLFVGLAITLGIYNVLGERLNFMNIIVLPILLGFGVSHGLYLLHRFLEGTSPMVALRSVGAAVAASTLTAVAGFGAMLWADHNGLRTVGALATIGLIMTLIVSFTVLAAVLQILHDRRTKKPATPNAEEPRSAA